MASYLLADNAPLGGVAGSPREWVLIPAYSERPWKSPEKGAHPLSCGPTIWLIMGKFHEPATISPCTITMDPDAIICSMIDGLTRGPDQDVHVPSVIGSKYPSYNVDVIYL